MVDDKRLSANPLANFAKVFAEQGATTARSAHFLSSIWSTGSPRPFHLSHSWASKNTSCPSIPREGKGGRKWREFSVTTRRTLHWGKFKCQNLSSLSNFGWPTCNPLQHEAFPKAQAPLWEWNGRWPLVTLIRMLWWNGTLIVATLPEQHKSMLGIFSTSVTDSELFAIAKEHLWMKLIIIDVSIQSSHGYCSRHWFTERLCDSFKHILAHNINICKQKHESHL